jgi:membrane protease YdiL (CAAX protease family)
MTRRRALPTAWRDATRAILPAGLLVLAAVVPWTRPFILAGLVAGTAIAIARDAPVRWAWAATVPVAVSLTFGLLPSPELSADPADCASPTSPVAMWRLGEAILVLGTAVGLAAILRASRATVWLGRPASSVARWAGVGLVASGAAGVALGAWLAGPFFGEIALDLSRPAAVLPALVFAVSNGVMEEVAYRGVLMGWLARVSGLWPASTVQAVVFGLAHASGADVDGSPLVLGLALGAGGLLAGLITVRTRSLAIPIAVHIGFDIALYLGLACRLV